jgi:hypothetical protein
MQTSTTQQPAKSRTQLRLPVEQYLPPPGAYYDQFSLALVLDIAFANDKCWCCWRSRKKCTMFAACTKACRVCHTSNHAGTVSNVHTFHHTAERTWTIISARQQEKHADRMRQTCPLLYCTPSWFRDRSADNRGPEIRAEARQFRPTRVELEVLKTMGVVLQTTRHDTPIRPNMAHALVQGFYRNKDAPNPVTTPYSGNKTTAPNIGRESLMRSDAPLSMPKLPEQQATMSLDPRLQGRFAYTTIDAAVPPAWFGVADTATEDEKQRNSECEVERDGEMEVRLQELEDEVLRLKIDNVAKDREIRRLKSENDKLRGTAHETGNKRQRV